MSLPELFLIAVGLSMDAFAVSICKGLSMCQFRLRHALVIGAYFGGFQALMPLAGYLLGIIGFNMIRESLSGEEESCDASIAAKDMLVLAVATSIDALAVGVTFAFLRVQIVPAVTFIGCTTFLLSMAGVRVGTVFGARYKSRAELAGGGILLLMGVKILVEHLFLA